MNPIYRKTIRRYLRWTFLSAMIGVLAGSSAAIFLISLEWVTSTRDHWPFLIFGLPLAGLMIGWVYHCFGKEAAQGNSLILEEIHNPRKIIPLRMAPLILGGTLMTHLFGGSAGREGTAVQMAASLADQLTRFFKIENDERKILLVAGVGAGFGAAIGAPWAGVIFGMEVIHVGRLRLFAWFECLVASFVGYFTAILLGAGHSLFPKTEIPEWQWKVICTVIVAGVIFGLMARLFSLLTHGLEKLHEKLFPYPPLRPFVGGVFLVLLYYAEGSFRYVGLGIPWIQKALGEPGSFFDPVYKTLFSVLTVGSGFKGGEFVPLVFIGTTLGSALAAVLPASFSLLASLGFVAVFAGAANAPVACTIMAMEIFGPQIGLYAALACFMSYICSGQSGIYKSNQLHSVCAR